MLFLKYKIIINQHQNLAKMLKIIRKKNLKWSKVVLLFFKIFFSKYLKWTQINCKKLYWQKSKFQSSVILFFFIYKIYILNFLFIFSHTQTQLFLPCTAKRIGLDDDDHYGSQSKVTFLATQTVLHFTFV